MNRKVLTWEGDIEVPDEPVLDPEPSKSDDPWGWMCWALRDEVRKYYSQSPISASSTSSATSP